MFATPSGADRRHRSPRRRVHQRPVGNYADDETILGLIVFVPAVIAELSIALWLLFKGIQVPQQKLGTLDPA